MAKRDIEDAVAEARGQIEEFLAGKTWSANLAGALETLRKNDVAYLKKLQTVLEGDQDLKRTRSARMCMLASSAFEEYLALQPDRREPSMPDIALHLIQCKECSRHFVVLEQSLNEVSEAWGAFRDSLIQEQPGALGRLAMWVWSKSTGFVRQARSGELLGEWLVGEMQPVGLKLSSPSTSVEARSLKLALPENAGTLTAWITPGAKGTLELEFELNRSVSMSDCTIGLGDERGPNLGTRILAVVGRLKFPVEIPAGNPCWVHLEWKMDTGRWRKHKTLLPIIVEEKA